MFGVQDLGFYSAKHLRICLIPVVSVRLKYVFRYFTEQEYNDSQKQYHVLLKGMIVSCGSPGQSTCTQMGKKKNQFQKTLKIDGFSE